jgi:hypothetical protein
MRPSVQQPNSKDKNVIARARKYYLKQLFDLEVKVPRRSLRYATHHLMVMHPHTKYHWPISKDKNVMAQTRKYYLQNNYLTLRSTVKVPRRSLRYATHCLMVIHPHTKYHWSILKDKNVMAWTRKYYLKNNYYNYLTLSQRSRSHKGHNGMRHTTPYGHAPTYQINTI